MASAPITPRPVKHHPLPAFPTRLQAQADPALLKEHVPAGWRACPEMTAILTLSLALSTAGCSEAEPETITRIPAIVAPIFQHGDGVGSDPVRDFGMLGCVAVAAPVYLSEEQALALIAEELAKAGLAMDRQNVQYKTITIQGVKIKSGFNWLSQKTVLELVAFAHPLQADLVSSNMNVAVEYVSLDEFYQLGGDDDPTDWAASLPSTAALVSTAVREQGSDLVFGAFYDPVVYYSFFGQERRESDDDNSKLQWAGSEQSAIEHAEQLVRLQVQDFVEWLKAQGVI